MAYDEEDIIIDEEEIKLDEGKEIIEISAVPGEPISVKTILPKNLPDDSGTQENSSPIDMKKSSDNVYKMPKIHGYRSPPYTVMPTERQKPKLSGSEISNDTESQAEIDIKKSIADILELIPILINHFISGEKSSELNLQTTHLSKQTKDQLSKFIQVISEKLTDSDLKNNDFIQAILENLINTDLKKSDSTQHTEDWLPECIKAVSEKLIMLKKETFRKAELTKALQKKFKAKKIEVALTLLTLQKVIIPVPEELPKRGGRPRSPKYRINFGENKKEES